MLSRIRHLVGFLRFHSVHLRNSRAIERYQLSRLQTLIPYLSEHIALYRQLLAERGVNQNCISRLEDLRLLPIIDKSLFAGRPVEEYTDQSRPLYGRWAKTSGSRAPLFCGGIACSKAPLYGSVTPRATEVGHVRRTATD